MEYLLSAVTQHAQTHQTHTHTESEEEGEEYEYDEDMHDDDDDIENGVEVSDGDDGDDDGDGVEVSDSDEGDGDEGDQSASQTTFDRSLPAKHSYLGEVKSHT